MNECNENEYIALGSGLTSLKTGREHFLLHTYQETFQEPDFFFSFRFTPVLLLIQCLWHFFTSDQQ